MNTYAIINNGIVENTIEYTEQPSTPPPGFGEGYTAVQADRVSPGWQYLNGVFTDPNPPAHMAVIPQLTLIEQILANPVELAKLKAALGVTV